MSRQLNLHGLVFAFTLCMGGAGGWSFAAAASGDGSEECLQGKLEQAQRAAAQSKAFDETTGRDLRNFPPDRIVDLQHMKLQMRFDNLDDRRFEATEYLTFTPIGTPTTGLSLDAINLKVESVKLGANTVEFSHDDRKLSLRFEPPLPVDQKHEVVIEYVCDNPIDGMTFTPSSPDAPTYGAEVHTQGQTNFNSHWFICHDSPNERMATELIVDVPAGYAVSSNGRLVSNLTSGDREVWHWLQEKPHPAYLVSLIIGKFEIVEIPHARVPMRVWVPPGHGDKVMQTYGRTGEMIDLFERRFGVPYPWDRYDQLCVKNFGAGGMENTSATTMYPTAILDKAALLDGDIDGLISHELAHQWTGDLITCKGWPHIWLNEGWATYGSALWNEERYGEEGYLDSVRGNFGVARRDKTTGEHAMCSHVYTQPGETFRRAGNPYPKGASILHMLRMMLGEDVFWRGVRLYMTRHALGTAETSDFRYAMEEVSGRGLEWFFEQWCFRPGTPELKVKVRYDGQRRELLVDVDQVQTIDERTPAFRFTLPVVARTASGDHTFAIDVATKTTSFRTTLDGPPSIVAVDPYLHVLKTMTVEKPLAMWIAQATGGPTIAAKHEAIDELGKTDSPDVIALLAELAHDDKLRYTLRNSAVDALAGYSSSEAKDVLLAMLKNGPTEARVRSNIVGKLRAFEKDRVIDLLTQLASNDASYDVRVAAIEALAHHKASDKADLIAELVDFQSQHDQVRNAALGALADLDDKRGLELGMKYAAYGHCDRSRPSAISAVGKLAKHDKDAAVTFLLGLLSDPESRAMGAAGRALAEIGDQRAIEPIKAIAETHRDPSVRERAAEWLKRIENPQEEEAATQPDGPPRRGRRGGRPD